jgi:hypothetical protein
MTLAIKIKIIELKQSDVAEEVSTELVSATVRRGSFALIKEITMSLTPNKAQREEARSAARLGRKSIMDQLKDIRI